MSNYIIINGELYHHGVKGMKWGKRKDKTEYRSTSIRSALARKSNERVDKGFEKWKNETAKKNNAIDLGKKANIARMAYEKNKQDKSLKKDYTDANKLYKKALKENTTFRKGSIRREVGSDISRKYLSEAKKVKKQLTNDPSNKKLQKQYDDFMSKHDVERAKARRAPEVAAKRSAKKASIKRGMTLTVKSAAIIGVAAAGAYAANRYLQKHEVTLNGKPVRVGGQNIINLRDYIEKGKDLLGYIR